MGTASVLLLCLGPPASQRGPLGISVGMPDITFIPQPQNSPADLSGIFIIIVIIVIFFYVDFLRELPSVLGKYSETFSL